MRNLLLILIIAIIMAGCGDSKTPDVSNIDITLNIKRFDQAFFENFDTAAPASHASQLVSNFPEFTADFFEYILDTPLPPEGDTSLHASNEMKRFYSVFKPVYDSIAPRYKLLDPLRKELEQSFKYVKYYFPEYQVPAIVTYIGPFEAPGVAVTSNAMAIGLQLFAGRNFSFYSSTEGQALYPSYISRRFEPQYITPNCMKAAIEDLHPDNSNGQSLIEQMIEKGKRWYVLDKLLPNTPDSLKTDYTIEQLKWVEKNEGLVWNYILKGTDIYSNDPAIAKNFIGEAPSTNGMPAIAPGNIGQWIGWQIVKVYVEKNPAIKLNELMKLDAKKIFTAAKYKPK